MNLNLTLIGQAISFAIFVVFCMKYVWPPIIQAMSERQAKIAEGLAAAERGAQAQDEAQREAAGELAQAKAQAAEIIATAQKRSNEIVDEAAGTARTEGERLVAAAHAEIEQERIRAQEELRKQVASIAIAGAEKILGSAIDKKSHGKVLDDLVAQI